MKNASPPTLDVLLIIRSASTAPLANGAIFDALERQGIDVHRADVTREGMTILCKGDVKTLRLCAEQLASLSFVDGVSMERCNDRGA
ncbi:hypothetical protein AWB74_08803 [Caballeronia arvi]|uniref:Uncharacterized protein n=1 Tax=Caballeronia arvi TaxID=1777135 RepID=A0A158L6L0_9BURK|nr:hypothetical protein AWB74_08803 [Caballeronia arvi]